MGECSVYSNLGVDSKHCSLAYDLAATWLWPTFAQMTKSEHSHMAGTVDDSTINIVLCIIILIILLVQ